MKTLLVAASAGYKYDMRCKDGCNTAALANEALGHRNWQTLLPANVCDSVVKVAKFLKVVYNAPYGRLPKPRKQTAHQHRTALVEKADAAVIFWDGKSRGTQQLIDAIERKGIPFVMYLV